MANKIESTAILTVYNVCDMSPKGRKIIAKWLREQAKDIEKMGDGYKNVVQAHYPNVDELYR